MSYKLKSRSKLNSKKHSWLYGGLLGALEGVMVGCWGPHNVVWWATGGTESGMVEFSTFQNIQGGTEPTKRLAALLYEFSCWSCLCYSVKLSINAGTGEQCFKS